MNHPPTYVRTFSPHKVSKNGHFLDHPPTSMSLRNIKMVPNSYRSKRTKKHFECSEIIWSLNIPNSPDKISSTRMRLQSSPAALSLKFTFCFAFSEKESGFAQPTITFAAAWRFHSVKIENLAFRWNCLIKDSKSPFSPLLYPIQVAFLYSFYCCCLAQFVCAQEHLNFLVHRWSCRLDTL